MVLKLKAAEFQVLTWSLPPPPASCEELTQIALSLREMQRFRFVGVGLGNFRDPGDEEEQSLFE